MTAATEMIHACDEYLGARTGKYEWRRERYAAAADLMLAQPVGLEHSDTLVDVGAGWTELDYFLRAERDWRGRYVPVDGGIDGTNLEWWGPPRNAEWIVGLEILEHLHSWPFVLTWMKRAARKGVVLSTPNPRTTDVLGMDPTHVVAIEPYELAALGFTVEERSFYGQPADSLFAWWLR